MNKYNKQRIISQPLVRLVLCVLVGFGGGSCQSDERQPSKPNIILIMSDDMGYSDLGCYGGEIETPVLDGLASDGVRFTQFYNGTRCCPSRASLLTGLYPHQAGIGHMTNPSENFSVHDYRVPGYRGELSEQTHTLAEVLKTAGYRTLMTGKWHLGMEKQEQWPRQRGFDRFYGLLDGASNFFRPVHPRGITLDNEAVDINDDDYYTTDAFTTNAIDFIKEGQEKDGASPFFLYLAYTAPHWPLQASKEVIDKYRDKYHEGWGVMRQERYEKMIEMGLVDPSWPLGPPDALSWDTLHHEKQAEMMLRRAIYAAQVDQMDQNIGRLVEYLKENGLFDNTLIIFINDNGACAEGGMLGGGKKEELETKEGYFLTYGQGWANASNTPYREYKHWVHEGGISSPLIAHWPNGIAEDLRGKLLHQYSFLPDIMATFVDIAEANYTLEKNNKPVPALVGKSFLPLFKGANDQIHQNPIFWEHEGNKAVRLGDYKAVLKWEKDQPETWELYDIANDRTESNDLSESKPEVLSDLTQAWEEWAATHQVQPWQAMLDSLQVNQLRSRK